MDLFRNRILLTLAALLALLVFSGDVLDDVWDLGADAVGLDASHSSGHQDSGTTKCCQHDAATLVGAAPLLIPDLLIAFRYSDIDEVVAPGAPPAIDHPPQLA